MNDKDWQPTTFVAYKWSDLLSVFPEGFAEYASDVMGSKGPSFGDAEFTIIKGTLAERILYRAWDTWEDGPEGLDRHEIFSRLPSLVNALVALNG